VVLFNIPFSGKVLTLQLFISLRFGSSKSSHVHTQNNFSLYVRGIMKPLISLALLITVGILCNSVEARPFFSRGWALKELLYPKLPTWPKFPEGNGGYKGTKTIIVNEFLKNVNLYPSINSWPNLLRGRNWRRWKIWPGKTTEKFDCSADWRNDQLVWRNSPVS